MSLTHIFEVDIGKISEQLRQPLPKVSLAVKLTEPFVRTACNANGVVCYTLWHGPHVPLILNPLCVKTLCLSSVPHRPDSFTLMLGEGY